MFNNGKNHTTYGRMISIKKISLSKKETDFCAFYLATNNSREAAARAGYRNPDKMGIKLLQKKEIKSYMDTIHFKSNLSEELIKGYRRLAFGSVADCIRLIFEPEIAVSELEHMDLFAVSEIKKPKDGSLEIKFFDRLKALQLLSEMTETSNTDRAIPFFDAIRKGAEAIRGDTENE